MIRVELVPATRFCGVWRGSRYRREFAILTPNEYQRPQDARELRLHYTPEEMSTLVGHSAPGQALGYLWQVHLALLRLAGGVPGGRVGLETLDDVTYESASGGLSLTQSKSTVNPVHNPVSDSSVQLWKSLATWMDGIIAAEIDPARTQLILVTSASLTDCVALRIGAAKDAGSVDAVAHELRTVPTVPSTTLKPYVARVRAGNAGQLAALIRCIEVQHAGTGHSHDGVREQVLAKCHLPEGVNPADFFDAMVGWLHNVAVARWAVAEPAFVTQSEFNNVRQRVVDSNRRRGVRELPSKAIACEPSAVESHRSTGFVRQLEIIDADAPTVHDAITDFLKHNHERLRLVKEGHVLDKDWIDFEERLIEHWKPVHRSQPPAKTKSEMRRIGRTVYNEIQKHKEALAGQPTDEYYLTRGAYQRLANAITLGWHPTYGSLVGRGPGS